MSHPRIGVLGGAFDPVHHGHLILAREAQEALGLHRVIFMPTAQSPLKGRLPSAGDEDRLAMLMTAVRDHETWEVSDWEIRKGGLSYTFDTVVHLRTRFPEAELYWIIGADQLERLTSWHKIAELGRLARFAVAVRNGDKLAPPGDLPVTVIVEPLPARRIDISSTEVRDRVREKRAGASLLVPGPVWQHITGHGLYRD